MSCTCATNKSCCQSKAIGRFGLPLSAYPTYMDDLGNVYQDTSAAAATAAAAPTAAASGIVAGIQGFYTAHPTLSLGILAAGAYLFLKDK